MNLIFLCNLEMHSFSHCWNINCFLFSFKSYCCAQCCLCSLESPYAQTFSYSLISLAVEVKYVSQVSSCLYYLSLTVLSGHSACCPPCCCLLFPSSLSCPSVHSYLSVNHFWSCSLSPKYIKIRHTL